MRIVLLGPPGAGKGTQARRIADELGVPAISTGDLFRAQIREQTELGRRAKEYLDAGELVPDEIAVTLVSDRLAQPDAQFGFVLDGFPRTVPQADALGGLLAAGGARLTCALELVLDEDELIRRLSQRRLLGDRSGIRREDDEPQIVHRRLAIYRRQTAPLSNYYESAGLLVRIAATGTVEEVTERAIAALRAVASRGAG